MSVLHYRTTETLHFYWGFFEMRLCKSWLMVSRERHSANITSAFYPIYCRYKGFKTPTDKLYLWKPKQYRAKAAGKPHFFISCKVLIRDKNISLNLGKGLYKTCSWLSEEWTSACFQILSKKIDVPTKVLLPSPKWYLIEKPLSFQQKKRKKFCWKMSYLQPLVLMLSLRVWKPLTLMNLLAIAQQCCKLPTISTSLQGSRNSCWSPTMGLADSWELQARKKMPWLVISQIGFCRWELQSWRGFLARKKLSQTGEAIPTVLINWLLIHTYKVICVLL